MFYVAYTVLLLDTVSIYFIEVNLNLLIEKYWYCYILLRNSIGFGIAITFTSKYWYCKYFFPVLLTALVLNDILCLAHKYVIIESSEFAHKDYLSFWFS